jgi:DDE family transposase
LRSWSFYGILCGVRGGLKEKDVLCLGHLRRAFALLPQLREVGCQRDRAGNRELHFDDYCKLVLLYTWNPLIQSLRDLQQVAELPKVAKALGIKRFSAGSFSESVRVFEPERLKPLIEELAGQLPRGRDPRLADFPQAITLVDATVVTGLSRLARSACGIDARGNTSRDGKAVYGWRLHIQLDLETFSAGRIDRTGARNAGVNRENNVLRRSLQPGLCYVGDGGYCDRSLFEDITTAGSSFVVRAAENSVFDLVEERLLSQEALDGNVVRDALVTLESSRTLRRVEVQVTPHPRRTRNGTRQTDLIILHTSLLELPAELIALIYLYRYTIELFFRILKQLLGMRHLLSQRREGIDIQIYCAMIVCVLIQLISGKKPNQAMRNMIGWYLLGLAEEQDVIRFLNKPDNTGIKLRVREQMLKKLILG